MLGHPRRKNFWSFSLFSTYYFPWLYCVDFSRVFTPSMSRGVRPKTQKRTMPNTWIQYIINLFHTSALLIYSFIQTQRMEINYMYDNQPFWPCLKVRILLYFAHANEVRKAYYHYILIIEYINRRHYERGLFIQKLRTLPENRWFTHTHLSLASLIIHNSVFRIP